MQGAVKQYLWNVTVGVSITFNALLGGRTMETLCFRMGLLHERGNRFAAAFAAFFHLLDPDHCAKSVRWYRRYALWLRTPDPAR
jgi:hypothetical protein